MGQPTEERVSRLEKTLDNYVTRLFRQDRNLEKLEEGLAELQTEVEELKKLSQSKSE
jgi:phage shock protein A